MKKFILMIFAAAALAVSCQKGDSTQEGASEVTFSVGVPAGVAVKSIGDGSSATELYYAVFDDEGKYLEGLAQEAPLVVEDKTAEITLKLVRNFTYTIVFWAQAPGAPYTFDPEEGVVTVDYSGDANDEKRDAFCKVHTFSVPDRATFEETVYLKRPFAQINFGAADLDYVTELGLDMKSTVVIDGLADTYDILNGVVYGNASTQFALTTVPAQCNPAETLVVEGKEYGYVSMNYVLAPSGEGSELATVSATFEYNGADVQVNVPNVPYRMNHRTNIIGSFFTDQVKFTIVVDEAFLQPDYNL
jgi:hypothetical protein